MENTRRSAYDAAFKLKAIDLAFEEGNRAAVKLKLTEAKSRALDNIGRVYARIGKFSQAIEPWEEKIPLASCSLEKAWLFHEIGRCYLELKQNAEARDYGLRSLAAADELGDQNWQLNASVLVAQSEGKQGSARTPPSVQIAAEK